MSKRAVSKGDAARQIKPEKVEINVNLKTEDEPMETD